MKALDFNWLKVHPFQTIGFNTSNGTRHYIKASFERFGEVESCCVIRDVSTNASRGFGFVKFRRVLQAEASIQAMHGKMLHGRALEVKFANADSSISTSAPVGNVSDNIYVKVGRRKLHPGA